MELYLEFHPHRFISRYNAIQKELEAREVVYMEDEGQDEGEEVGPAEEEGEQGQLVLHAIIEILTDLVGPFEGIETHQKAVPLPPLESGHDQGPEGELVHPLAYVEANISATSYADQSVPAETGKKETGPGKLLPPLAIVHVSDRQPQT